MKKLLFSTLVALILNVTAHAGYNIAEMEGEEITRAKPFKIVSVEQKARDLWIYIESDKINEVSKLLKDDAFQAETSLGDVSTSVQISLHKVVKCVDSKGVAVGTFDIEFSAPLPSSCTKVDQSKYYILAPSVTISGGRDFGIGLDPDYMWLIEEE